MCHLQESVIKYDTKVENHRTYTQMRREVSFCKNVPTGKNKQQESMRVTCFQRRFQIIIISELSDLSPDSVQFMESYILERTQYLDS